MFVKCIPESVLPSPRCRAIHSRSVAAWAAAIVLIFAPAALAYDAQSDGSDGAFTVSGGLTSVVINLGEAATGPWNMPSPVPGKGVYDPEQWAVVFKYTTINVPAGVTVTFINHPKGAPVVWLASGNVTINGTVNLNGAAGTNTNTYAKGGPGGFAGGIRFTGSPAASAGSGPGGGHRGCWAASAGHAQIGLSGDSVSGGGTYGSPTLLPLIGGSGGGGTTCDSSSYYGGGGGGGAILIASSGIITGSGSILADGGPRGGNFSGHGSGGGIRLIAGAISGNCTLRARGGDTAATLGSGRIRLETSDGTQPQGVSCIPTPSVDVPGPLFPPANAPKVLIESIHDSNTPFDPAGNFAWSEDVLISKTTGTAEIVIRANNVPPGTNVTVRLVRDFGASVTSAPAPLIGKLDESFANVTMTIPAGRSVLQVRAVLP